MKSFRPFFEMLEPRLVLDAMGVGAVALETTHADPALEAHVEGTNGIDPSLPKGHNKHVDHMSWDTDPVGDGLVTVSVLIHDHGNLSADALARLNDSVAEVNSAAVNFGVNLNLVTVTDPAQLHNIHLHEDSTSACGASALGCAEFRVYINHTGKFGDGHGNHRYAGEEVADIGGRAEATLLSGSDWYTGADPNLIGSDQYDYQTVATQELLHLVGLSHDSTIYDSDPEVAGNTNHQSVMHGFLGQGEVRRAMSTHDQVLLGHLYGPGQTSSGDDGGGGSGKDKGPPPGKGNGKGRNKMEALLVTDSVVAEGIETWLPAESASTPVSGQNPISSRPIDVSENEQDALATTFLTDELIDAVFEETSSRQIRTQESSQSEDGIESVLDPFLLLEDDLLADLES